MTWFTCKQFLLKLFSSAHFVMALEDQLPLTPAKAAKARADPSDGGCLPFSNTVLKIQMIERQFQESFTLAFWNAWSFPTATGGLTPASAGKTSKKTRPLKIPDLVCIRWIHQRSKGLFINAPVPQTKYLPYIGQPALNIFNFCKYSCKPAAFMSGCTWRFVATDAGLVFQPTFFSLFCCKLKKPSGVTEGSPCALASTAPDTVFEALEEAATLFAQQRQKVVVWWFVSVWWWSLEKKTVQLEGMKIVKITAFNDSYCFQTDC